LSTPRPAPPAPRGARGAPAPHRRPAPPAGLRRAWAPTAGPVRHYAIHQVLPGGGDRFLGATCQLAMYVPALHREAGEAASRIEVRAVGELFDSSAPTAVDFAW
ncbi:GH85 family endohexosaminidase C-terminal domain-containing protein, partial [Streptomyces sp. NPDC054933]